MLRLFRNRAWCLVTAVLLALGTTTAAFDELLHASGRAHDTACVPVLDVAHDASSHRVDATDEGTGGEGHCLACHFARTPRHGAQPATHGHHVDEPRAVKPAVAVASVASAVLDNLPPRSPPQLS
jgi:hypothetical protein